MSKKSLFIADLHLQASNPEKNSRFIHFLETTAKNVHALYILGDFFEVWLGDDDNADYLKAIKAVLKNYTTKHKLYFMRGNRDFLLGKKFCNETGIELIDDPTVININNTPTLLTHGDIYCSDDPWHLRYRKVVNNKFLQYFVLLLPLKVRKLLASILRKRSKKNRVNNPKQSYDIPFETLINTMQKYQVTQLIHGHIHKEIKQEIVIDEVLCKRFSLPEWNNHKNTLIM
ncbi:MAG: UDP-2,3-diacylglucosamine diphosphatase [Gammaproteobacteria bacterium]|nr:UDP-2,3-diacylglucosamine diphosphatase [Gammaproteobacteria bacterium]